MRSAIASITRSQSRSLSRCGRNWHAAMKVDARGAGQRAGVEFLQAVECLVDDAVGFAFFCRRSNSKVSDIALTRCAAICAPMTPHRRTATLRM